MFSYDSLDSSFHAAAWCHSQAFPSQCRAPDRSSLVEGGLTWLPVWETVIVEEGMAAGAWSPGHIVSVQEAERASSGAQVAFSFLSTCVMVVPMSKVALHLNERNLEVMPRALSAGWL